MERTLTRRQSDAAFIAPAHHGWRVQRADNGKDGAGRVVESLGDAAAAIPADEEIHLALPASAVLMERMRLPSTNREELDGMVRLQLEKTLPFTADEVAMDLEIIEQGEAESTVLALAASNEQLDALCEPLRAQRRLPGKITFYAMHLAALCPQGETVCVIFREQDAVVLAVAQSAKLAYAQTFSATEAEGFFTELPQALLSAELEGVPVGFHRAQLDDQLADWRTKAVEFFSTVPLDLISLAEPMPDLAINLVPATWTQERRQIQRASRMRSQLMLIGAAYLVLLLCAAGYVIWLQRQARAIDQQVASAAPQVDLLALRKARWSALAPAIDPPSYSVEILFQISNSVPSEDVRITTFDQTPGQFMVEGEAPTAALAIDFGERLKNNPELKQFSFNIAPPTILPNEHAQFRIFGKL